MALGRSEGGQFACMSAAALTFSSRSRASSAAVVVSIASFSVFKSLLAANARAAPARAAPATGIHRLSILPTTQQLLFGFFRDPTRTRNIPWQEIYLYEVGAVRRFLPCGVLKTQGCHFHSRTEPECKNSVIERSFTRWRRRLWT